MFKKKDLAIAVAVALSVSQVGLAQTPAEIAAAEDFDTLFYYGEAYHQQYLAKNVNGYCAMKGTGISCSI